MISQEGSFVSGIFIGKGLTQTFIGKCLDWRLSTLNEVMKMIDHNVGLDVGLDVERLVIKIRVTNHPCNVDQSECEDQNDGYAGRFICNVYKSVTHF